jgi:hypothetical protein
MPTFQSLGVPIVLLSSIGDVFIDLMEEVSVTLNSRVSEHPSETGHNMSDNIVNLPAQISMSGRFVDNALPVAGNLLSFVDPAVGALTSVAALAVAVATVGQPTRSAQLWEDLQQLRNRKERITVVIQQGAYENMVVKSLIGPRSPGDGGSQRFRIELAEIVTTFTFIANDQEALASDFAHTGGPVNDLGVQGTPTVP